MLIFKIGFLTVLLSSVVYLSASGNDDKDGEFDYTPSKYNDLTNCLVQLNPFFGEKTNPLTCVRRAITNMVLFGDYSTTFYRDDVKEYYELLHLYIIPDDIPTPEEFCFIDGKMDFFCLKLIKVFELDMGFDHKLKSDPPNNAAGPSEASQTELDIGPSEAPLTDYNDPYNTGDRSHLTGDLSDILKNVNPLPDESFFPENITDLLPEGPSTQNPPSGLLSQYVLGGLATKSELSTQDTDEEILIKKKSRILLNALYFHRVVGALHGMTHEQRITHHLKPSCGQKYIAEINRHIRLKQVSGKNLLSPLHYCHGLYKNQLPMCDSRKLTNIYIKRGIRVNYL